MSEDPQVAISFVRAVEHSNIPLEDDAQSIFERDIFSNNATTAQNSQRETMQSMSNAIDGAVQQIDVRSQSILAHFVREKFILFWRL